MIVAESINSAEGTRQRQYREGYRKSGMLIKTEQITDTRDEAYAKRLQALQSKWWKRWFDVQAPYRIHMCRLGLGLTLDVGCGIGRSLLCLRGNGVGVDHNAAAVKICRSRGLKAYTPEEFQTTEYSSPGTFDAIMLSHTAEHMSIEESVALLRQYESVLTLNAKLLLITPQEKGYASDASHVCFVDHAISSTIAHMAGYSVEKQYSFPFPRWAGKLFIYNEFITLGRRSTEP